VDICLPESGGHVERRAGERGGHFISLQTTMAIDFLVTPKTLVHIERFIILVIYIQKDYVCEL